MAQRVVSTQIVPIGHAVDLLEAPHRLRQAHRPAFLHSAAFHRRYGRYSILASDPIDHFEMGLDSAWPTRFRETVRQWPSVAASRSIPFVGGWLGYITYDAGAILEGLRPRTDESGDEAEVSFGLYDHVYVFDHVTNEGLGVAVDWPKEILEGKAIRPARERFLEFIDTLEKGQRRHASDIREKPVPDGRGADPGRSRNFRMVPGRAEYLDAVQRAKEHIAAGDIYQINLAVQYETESDRPSAEIFRQLCEQNPARYAAWIQEKSRSLVSSSPELFLEVRDREIMTRPIKGTRPRTGDEQRDTLRQSELRSSEKERAELNMIIDLMRNDLGRVCELGSIRVESASELEALPTVYHNVATVAGRLRSDRDVFDLLAAALPGGSITGCPKVRAMQIIQELEPFHRGPYCGCIGWIGLDGSMTLNIAIRTMLQEGRRLRFWAGSGIVADSNPEMEYEETVHKARGMLAALGLDADERMMGHGRSNE